MSSSTSPLEMAAPAQPGSRLNSTTPFSIGAQDVGESGFVTFDSEKNEGVLYVKQMALHFRVGDSLLELWTAGNVRLSAEGSIAIAAEKGIFLQSGETSLEIRPSGVELKAARIQMQAHQVSLETREIAARATLARFTWTKLEQTTGRMLLYARHVYERVQELLHTRAGRIRTEAVNELLIQGESARVRAEKEVTISGERINLA